MILECPLCRSKFLVPAHLFKAGPRQVRCTRCRHNWQATGEEPEVAPSFTAEVAAASAPATAPPEKSISLKQRLHNFAAPVKNLLARWKALTPKRRRAAKTGLASFAIVLAISVFIFARDGIAERWPAMDRVYQFLRLEINHDHGGAGLAFEDMRSELRYDDGEMRLYVQGKIRNKTNQVQGIPPLLATALGADGHAIQSWRIAPPAANVAPGADVTFLSSITAPRDGTAVNVNVNFLGNVHAAQ